jgi:hypothetical protein
VVQGIYRINRDVELGFDRRLYALSQGIFTLPDEQARRAHAGRRTARPPDSVAFSRRNAYVVTLTGKVLKISGLR